jgi:hypothetical protein
VIEYFGTLQVSCNRFSSVRSENLRAGRAASCRQAPIRSNQGQRFFPGWGFMFLRQFVHFVLIVGLVFGPVSVSAADQDTNIRLRNRKPGLYVAPLPDSANSEVENFTTSTDPLAPLSDVEIEKYISEHPELEGWKLVIIGPAVRGSQAGDFKKAAEAALQSAGTQAQVQIIRHPQGLRENLFNLYPRREDHEKPSVGELKVMGWKVFLAESLSFTVLLVPAYLKASSTEISPWIDDLVAQIGLRTDVAWAMCVMDVANMVPLFSYRRALSNHNIRLNPYERFARQFILSMFFSFNFYALSQSPAILNFIGNGSLESIWNYLTQSPFGEIGGDAVKHVSSVLGVIVPASVLNTLARTTVGTSQNIWEQRQPNRRFVTAVVEALTGLVIGPSYILSTMPFLEPVVNTPIMDLNAAHLGLLGMGAAGAAAWIGLERKAVYARGAEVVASCSRRLAAIGKFFSGK